MTNDNINEFYGQLGFEQIEVEDRLTALFIEVSPDGEYALVTDDNGVMPETLKQTVVFACYTSEGAFLWSTSFKNSYLLRDAWSENQPIEEKFLAVKNKRKE
ncbi:hypothetical protein [Dendrosporobacter sp. 1207_IL3150]|uniref:hypothetical protein n=1 Tax=Dendrosporobacter sp. 1207_IL3150 TaxID=3084054 RepID=UPI002FD8BD9A